MERYPSISVKEFSEDSSSSSEDSDMEMASTLNNNHQIMILACLIDNERKRTADDEKIDRRCLGNKRTTRTIYWHDDATRVLKRDFFGLEGYPLTPLFKNKDFQELFRISRSRFQRLLEDIGRINHPFYSGKGDAVGRPVASFEARLLLPLKTLAYGVTPNAFRSDFQMSKSLCRMCCVVFDEVMKQIYQEEYLRKPSPTDVKGIVHLHEEVHGVPGMFGSLDCCHTDPISTSSQHEIE